MILEPSLCHVITATIFPCWMSFLWVFVKSTSIAGVDFYFPRHSSLRDDQVNQQELEQHQQPSFLSYPLYLGYGEYYVEVFIGNPTPQRLTLLVDTGSDITTFPCQGCRSLDCDPFQDHLDPIFLPNISSTYEQPHCPNGCIWSNCYDYPTSKDGQQQQQHKQQQEGPCTINNFYSEGKDWKLVEGKDWFYISVPSDKNDTSEKSEQQIMTTQKPAFKLSFACMIHTAFSQAAMERHLADGVMVRLHVCTVRFRNHLSDYFFFILCIVFFTKAMGARSQHSFMGQIYRENSWVSQNQFSLCLGKKEIKSKNYAGVLTIGGLDARLHQKFMAFAQETGARNYFEVYVENIYLRTNSNYNSTGAELGITKVDLDPIDLNARGVTLRSEIPYTYLSSSISKAFRRAWRDAVGVDYVNNPPKLSSSQLDLLPTILFQFRGLSSMDYNSNLDPYNFSGFAGSIDPTSPYDVIVAMSPMQYMEYNEGSKTTTFTSRLYLDASEGSVLGQNFMQHHNVFFDLDRHLVGFAESHCLYTSLDGKALIVNEMALFGVETSHNSTKMETLEQEKALDPSYSQHVVVVLLAIACSILYSVIIWKFSSVFRRPLSHIGDHELSSLVENSEM